LSSASSQSSTSISSASSPSSASSTSSFSSESSSVSSASSSSTSLMGCEYAYCSQDFVTANVNGTYTWTGGFHNSKPIYNNGTYDLFYAWIEPSYYWAASVNYTDPIISWVALKDTPFACPDGAYNSGDGDIYIGECSSTSSVSSLSSQSTPSSASSMSSPSSSSESSVSSPSSSSKIFEFC
jgi:hypothetical protein